MAAVKMAGEDFDPEWYKLNTATQVIIFNRAVVKMAVEDCDPEWYKLYTATQVMIFTIAAVKMVGEDLDPECYKLYSVHCNTGNNIQHGCCNMATQDLDIYCTLQYNYGKTRKELHRFSFLNPAIF